ncbi:3-oxoacyl-ACP reductase FabG [bacterium]|nr:3-oxoacyl-ACP reductase FabG [bacterium]
MNEGVKARVLITGASRGIGAACAKRLARAGYHIVMNFRENQAKAQAVQAGIVQAGGSAELLPFDVSDREACLSAITQWVEKNGALHAMVLNAGMHADAPLAMMLPEEWEKIIGVNLNSFYNVVKPALKEMLLARRGTIVAVTSVSGLSGMAGQVNYAAAKAGIIGAVKALAKEVGKRKIRVNAVAPGFIETDMIAGIPMDKVLPMIPLGRVGKADEVAAAIEFFLSDQAAYITGQVLSMNGGILI